MAKKKAAAKQEQSWPYYELGGIAIGVSPHPEAEDAYALFVVVGDTGYAVAGYADEADAREAAEVLEEAMGEAQKLHSHEGHDHGAEEFEIELDDLEDAPKKKKKKEKAKAKAKAKAAKKPAKRGKSKK